MPNAGVKSKKLKDSKNNSTLPKQKGANGSNILEEFESLSKAISIIENVKFKMGLEKLLKDCQTLKPTIIVFQVPSPSFTFSFFTYE